MRQLEQPGLVPDEQLGAALAYLEVLWLDACAARRRDRRRRAPCSTPPSVSGDRTSARQGPPLPRRRAQRCASAVARRVAALIGARRARRAAHEHAGS